MVTTEMPHLRNEGQLVMQSTKILQIRTVRRNNANVVQWLVQWSHTIPEDASWEVASQIMDMDSIQNSILEDMNYFIKEQL